MSDSPRQPEITDEELIAYLDGELDDVASRRIENLLITDSHIRRKLQELERTWELLDQLDVSGADEYFTRSTLEMVAVAAAQEVGQTSSPGLSRSWHRWLLGIAVLLLTAGLGFAGTWLLAPDPDRQLLEDLPLLENLDCYRQIDDFQFLNRLHELGLFQEDWPNEG